MSGFDSIGYSKGGQTIPHAELVEIQKAKQLAAAKKVVDYPIFIRRRIYSNGQYTTVAGFREFQISDDIDWDMHLLLNSLVMKLRTNTNGKPSYLRLCASLDELQERVADGVLIGEHSFFFRTSDYDRVRKSVWKDTDMCYYFDEKGVLQKTELYKLSDDFYWKDNKYRPQLEQTFKSISAAYRHFRKSNP